uniref:non-specific serine/threonine protein kinase n=1 Tax=Oryzias sinensis TaxID=183150 RepID=A0A8C7XJ39_9TELE
MSDGSTGDVVSASPHLPLVVSLMVLLAVVVLLVNCVTCCKEREINFKEFEDHFDDEIDFTPPAEDTPSMQSPAEVYTLAVSPVPLPGPPHLQPLANSQVARHNLSYIQEIGNGWFGQVLLSEMYTDPGGVRVVVKELKANANGKEQNDFLQQGDPYRVLEHPNILQCLGQCVEAIPFLLVFEYCEMGDLRAHLSQQDWMFRNAELLQLQRMACEIAAGVTHLHKHNFLHSDLALRNCYLTADLTVKVGDYGIGPYRYKEDYIITEDDTFAPLRWLAPELVGERHGGVIALEQTKPSNVWYEILQFCWLSPERRATAEEVHRLLIYLRMQGQKDVEEDFEQRWDALKPNPSSRQTISHSSFPILDQFADDALRHEIDEVLTVTETSKGLSFEYVWEAAKHDHYDGHHACSGMDTTLNYHSMFFPISREDIQAHFPDPLGKTRGDDHSSGVTGILPVFDAQKSSNGNEYFIQLEEQENTVNNGGRGQDLGFTSSRQDFVVLQDARLDESSTDADFFHQSIDSKDSYLPDSHIWSSLENDSPYHTNIFTEDGSKQGDSPPWSKSFMELPERNGNPFIESSIEGQEVHGNQSYGNPFLDDPSASLEEERISTDDRNPRQTEELSGNFVFLRDHNLNTTDSYSKPAPSSASSRQELLDFESANFGDALVENSTLVPSITVVADDNTSSYLPVVESSSFKDRSLPQSSDRGVDSGFDSTSEKVEIVTDGHSSAFSDSATNDSLCTYANIASLDDDDPTTLQTADKSARKKMPEYFPVYGMSSENGHSEDLTSNDLFSELIEDMELETTLSDHDEAFVETNGEAAVRSSLLVSGPSLDQISQDSLLEDSCSTTVPTAEHPAETPDSLDSLDIHRLAEQADELSTQTLQHKLHPPYKISDSGYETENLESPEWNSQPSDRSPVKNGSSITKESEELASAANLVPPKIVISEVEGLLENCGEDFHEGQQTDRPAEELFMGGSYRDSAYFSDNDSEPEKKSDEAAGGAADAVLLRNSAQKAAKERDIDALFSEQDANVVVNVDAALKVHKEDFETKVAEPVNEKDKKTPQLSNATSAPGELEDPAASSRKEPERGVHPKLTRTYASDCHKIKEPDVEGRYLGRGEDLDGQEDGVDADEEDENSEDSDDDLRGYQLHSSSSDSEDEAPHPVPVIVSDDSNSKHLKSLLKPTTLSIPASTSPCPVRSNAENSRRAVSFFDDVTVYLFDQETPTKELSDHLSGPNSQTSEFNSPVPAAGFPNRFGNSESSTDEEGGGFEWDDDFTSSAPAFRSRTNKDSVPKAVLPSAPMGGGRMPEPSWTSFSAYSRFSISPASLASFSLTHLTDSDIEQGGSSEDGDKD